MSRKKILIVSDYIEGTFGGIETYIHNLKKVLPNYQIEYFWWKNIVWLKKYIWLILSNFNIFYAKKFEEKIQKFKPDIIWFHSISRFLWPKILEKLNNFWGITIMTYHDLWYFSLYANNIWEEEDIPEKFTLIEFLKKAGKKWLIFLPYSIYKYFRLKSLKQKLAKYVKFHTVPSKFMKKYVQNLWYSNKVEVLPNFILKEQLVERKNLYQDKINFIFFGRLERWKWVGLLINFLSQLWELKYKNKEEYKKIISKIRIFIFWNGNLEKELLETFTWVDLNWKDISIIQDLRNFTSDTMDFIDTDNNKFIYFFWKRDFNYIKKYIAISHYNLVPSLFLETFGLSAVEWAANWVVNIGLNKENLKNFILEDFRIPSKNITENFNKKLLEIIKSHNLEKWKENSKKNKKLVEKYII